MRFIADLHIHSHYSRATSRDLTFPELYRWALYKGIHVVGTGDFTHPGWIEEMKECLEPAPEPGLYRLKADLARKVEEEMPAACRHPVRFLLSTEISNIYKKNGRTRKVHNLFYAPDLETVEKIYHELDKVGNLKSDGRPILGMDSKHLFETMLGISPQIYLIPAHVWTPWFSVLGSKSGFDDVRECFEELTDYIFAVETGLSSDPPMNWLCSQLDPFTLVSSSDAHSPGKLGREANLFDTELSYEAIFAALRDDEPGKFLGTIEFHPEEGKYHLDGHRKCGVCLTPEQTIENKGLCPVCKKKVTVGVMHRVIELSDHEPGRKAPKARPFESILALPSILGEVLEVGVGSKKVKTKYQQLLAQFGSEFDILRNVSLELLAQQESELFSEAIRRVREQQLDVQSGYDGEFGEVKLFGAGEREQFLPQDTFFQNWGGSESVTDKNSREQKKNKEIVPLAAALDAGEEMEHDGKADEAEGDGLTDEQRQAVEHSGCPLLIVAGPGTGKTRTLTMRIAHLVQSGISPDSILAITFTNKAAEEMEHRLTALLGEGARDIHVCTFHRLGLEILREHGSRLAIAEDFAIYDSQEILATLDIAAARKWREAISKAKAKRLTPEEIEDDSLREVYQRYQQILRGYNGVDLDDLIILSLQLLADDEEVRKHYQQKFRVIAVDEYQDINQAQYSLLEQLVTEATDFCAIGDPDQAIYGFRGAEIKYFLRFGETFANAQQLRLSRNYRCPRPVLQASRAVIAHNASHLPGQLVSQIPGDNIHIYEAASEEAEAEFVVHTIEQLLGGTSMFSFDSGRTDDGDEEEALSFRSFAVLYRIHSQSKALEEAFARSGMPYQIIGGKSLWNSARMRHWQRLLRLLENPQRPLELLQLCKHLPGVGEQTIQEIATQAQERQLPPLQIIEDVAFIQRFPGAASQSLSLLAMKIGQWRQMLPLVDLPQILSHIANGLPWPSWQLEAEAQNALMYAASRCRNLRELLQYIALQGQNDMFDPRAEKIALMTLHSAKGLEFPIVFVIGCEQELLPYQPPGKRQQENDNWEEEQEEERRLFYVGMTRTQQRLYLVRSKQRLLFGKQRETIASGYLDEIPGRYKQAVYRKQKAAPAKEKQQQHSQQQELFDF